MGADSNIEWTTHTFNPWRGCTKVSPGCANCYAEKNMSVKLHGVEWGPGGNRIVAENSGWQKPIAWDRAAKAAGERHRVFCASLADVFEDWKGPMMCGNTPRHFEGEVGICHGCGEWLYGVGWDCGGDTPMCERVPRRLTMQDVRNRLFALIDATPNLDWLVLTKRPENIGRMMPAPGGLAGAIFKSLAESVSGATVCRANLWLGVSVEDQARANERIPLLLKTPAAVRFLSVEPLLGPVDLRASIGPHCSCHPCPPQPCDAYLRDGRCPHTPSPIGWVIVGCESGKKRRPMEAEWATSIAHQCEAHGTKFFMKQMDIGGEVSGDVEAFPVPLNIRRFPATLQGAAS